jgi:hypothetical protein
MQGTYWSRGGIGAIQALGFLERARVEGLDGIETRPALVIRLDAVGDIGSPTGGK